MIENVYEHSAPSPLTATFKFYSSDEFKNYGVNTTLLGYPV